MPLNIDSIVQQNSGSFVGTSGSATLGATTTPGNVLLLMVAQSGGLVDPSGFTLAKKLSIGTCVGGFYFKTAGSESSWTIAPSASNICCWVVYEVAGLDTTDTLDVVVSAFTNGTGSSLATNTTPMVDVYDGLIVDMHACLDTTSTTPGTWSGHTGGLTEQTEVGGNDGSKSLGLSVSLAFSQSIQTWACTATKTPPSGQAACAGIAVYSAAGARHAVSPEALTGFEYGTTAGMNLPSAGGSTGRLFDTVTGTPAIVTTNPRSGTYCLELSSSAAAESVTWGEASTDNLGGVGAEMAVRLSVYFPTSLPAADVVLFSATPATAGDAVVCRFINSTSKIGMKVGSGAEISTDAVVTANTWVSLDWRIDGRTTTHLCDWQVTYADGTDPIVQTQATATATIVSTGWTLRLGWTDSGSRTVRYDDVIVGRKGWYYPFGDISVLALTPDPAGTVTLSGTSTNFQTFTSNGTLVAWDATVARNNIDELPPTIGSSADGFAQVATATSDYVEVPMTTVNAANLGSAFRGLRLEACGWAASTTASTLGIRTWDGSSEVTTVIARDQDFDNSTTTPAWMVKMCTRTPIIWDQTAIDALAFRVGFSSDASPAVGIHAIYGEVALCKGKLVRVGEAEDATFTADFRIDPDSAGVIQIIITTPDEGRGATFTWAISGVDQTPIYVGPNTTHTENIGATDIATMTSYSLTPDPVG